jgi:hypothetical protein
VGGNLFDFGDQDGHGDEVRLQHPLGIYSFGDKLLVADTYNHRIKELDPKKREVKTLFGTGKPGQADGKSPSFYEPAGLSVANGKLYIADANNHAIRVIDLKTKEASTLHIKGLEPPATTAAAAASDEGPNADQVTVPVQRLRAGATGTLVVAVELPPRYHLNPAAPQRYRVTLASGPGSLRHFGFVSRTVTGAIGQDIELSKSTKELKLPLSLPFQTLEAGAAELRVQLTLFYCREDNTGVCRIKTLVWRVPVEVTTDAGAASEVKLEGKLKAE